MAKASKALLHPVDSDLDRHILGEILLLILFQDFDQAVGESGSL